MIPLNSRVIRPADGPHCRIVQIRLTGCDKMNALWKGLLIVGMSMGALASEPEALLSPEQAFPAYVVQRSGDRVLIRLEVASGYALYRDQIRVELIDGADDLRRVDIPAGEEMLEPDGSHKAIMPSGSIIAVDFEGAERGPIRFRMRSQGCAPKRGVCFNPSWRAFVAD